MKLSDMTSRVFCIVKIDAPGKESVKAPQNLQAAGLKNLTIHVIWQKNTEELSLRNLKGENKIAAFNETFEFKVRPGVP